MVGASILDASHIEEMVLSISCYRSIMCGICVWI